MRGLHPPAASSPAAPWRQGGHRRAFLLPPAIIDMALPLPFIVDQMMRYRFTLFSELA
jgi:hypothetical protein